MSGARSVRRRVRLHAGVLAAMGLLALLTPALPLQDPTRPHLDRKLEPPRAPSFAEEPRSSYPLDPGPLTGPLLSLRHAVFGDVALAPVLGTDPLGRCLLSRLCWGARISLAVGLLASLVGLVIGVGYGTLSGLGGRKLDEGLMRLLDVLQSLPLLFLVIFVMSFVRGIQAARPEFALGPETVLLCAIGAVSWLVMARTCRGHVRSLRHANFLEAAQVSGASPLRLWRRHVLPNLWPLVLVTLTLTVPRVILLETFLSFLGLGVDAPDVSWGHLAREAFAAITPLSVPWWLVLFPGLALGITLHSLNALGDALRDRLDPSLAEQLGPAPEAAR